MIRSVILLVVIGACLVTPDFADAQSLATLAQCSGTDCSFCNLVHLANGLIKWLIGFLFILFGVLMAVAGFKLVTSGGNQSALDDAKESLTNAIIGIIIVLAAWLIVDTIMRGLVGTDDNPGSVQYVTGWLYWSTVECQVQEETVFNEYRETTVLLDISNMLNPTNIVTVPTVNPGGTYTPAGGTAPDGQFTYQSGIEAQRAHASTELEMLLRCMASIVPGDVGQISSISDSRIVAAGGSDEIWQSCWAGGCAHTGGSCHYGNGYGMVGSSYAVDFGDENNAEDLIGAAYACGAGYAGVHNGNHVHVSSAACRGN